MRDVPKVVPDVDFTLSRHFLGLIEQGDRQTSSFLHAIDHRAQGLDLKSYFITRDESTGKEWDEAITKLDPDNAAHHTLKNFLTNNSEGKLMFPMYVNFLKLLYVIPSLLTCDVRHSVLAWDNVAPSKSRLKYYFLTENTSFKSMREIMTIGGLHDIPEEGMQDLRSLIITLLELPNDYPENENFPIPPPANKKWKEQEDQARTFAYYFDIAAGQGNKPDVKFYLPTRSFGGDDYTLSRRLVEWMKVHGRGDYGERYLNMVDALAEHRGLANGKGLHSYITYQFGKGGVPDIKSYLIPETYHPTRFDNVIQNSSRFDN
jgi:DMATS type aromatic prenyltransferase